MIAPDLQAALESIARSRILVVASDYDGTLSPIVDDPDAAVPDESALSALVTVAAAPSVRALVVSGRSQDDLVRLSGAPSGVVLIGNHGASHPLFGTDDLNDRREVLMADIQSLVTSFPGTRSEVKPFSVALHYRNAHDPQGAAAAARSVATTRGERILEGKMVVEIMLVEGNKGTAVAAYAQQNEADAIVFFGDDVTDEDVFRIMSGEDVSVKVGPGDTAAQFRVSSPEDVGTCLEILADALLPFRR